MAYLNPARKRPNLEVRTGALVRRVLLEGSRCSGVEYALGGQRHTALAGREVVLCAGAIQSPQLLELSGIGNLQCLQKAGIQAAHSLPAVGENMSDHLQVRRAYRSNIPGTINDLMRSPLYKVRAGLQYLFTRRGLRPGQAGENSALLR